VRSQSSVARGDDDGGGGGIDGLPAGGASFASSSAMSTMGSTAYRHALPALPSDCFGLPDQPSTRQIQYNPSSKP